MMNIKGAIVNLIGRLFMRKLSGEQPPSSLQSVVREWLSRLVSNTNACFDQVHDLPKTLEIPSNPQDGMIRYFPAAILPDITSSGFWGYDSGTWTKLN